MARAFLLIRLNVIMVAALAAASASAAPGDAGKQAGGSLARITAATASGNRVVAPAPGVGLAPKAIVSNPYNVPLLQNAGSLRATR